MSLNVLAPSVRWKTWRPSPTNESLRQRAMAAGLDSTSLAVTLGSLDTLDALAKVCAGRPPAAVRSAASLTVRCGDCDGRAVAWVLWVSGRPLFLGDTGEGNASALLLDVPGFAPPRFRCRSVTWGFTWGVSDLPRPGAMPEVMRVGHDGRVGMR